MSVTLSLPALVIRRLGGEVVENPDPAIVAAAERAVRVHARDGKPFINFQSPLGGIYYVANPRLETYP